MNIKHTASSPPMDEIPIAGSPCYIKISKSQELDGFSSTSSQLLKVNGCRRFLRDNKLLLLLGILSITLVLSVCLGLVFILKNSVVSWEKYEPQPTPITEDEMPYDELLRTAYTLLPEEHHDRLKREIASIDCNQKLAHCKSDLHITNYPTDTVNKNKHHLEELLRSLSKSGEEGQSTILDIIDCFKCKGIEILSRDNETTETDGQYNIGPPGDSSSIDTVIKLLDNHKDPASDKIQADLNSGSDRNFVVTASPGDMEKASEKEDGLNSVVKGDEPEAVTGSVSSSAIPSASTSGVPDALSGTETLKIADSNKEVTTILNDAPSKEQDDVAEMASGELAKGVNQGDASDAPPKLEEEGVIDVEDFRRTVPSRNFGRRIVSNEQLQAKVTGDGGQMIIPTAETIKSSQQLQLTPTMSWMQYPVCFYGPPASGSMKQSAPGQVIYPASSPGTPYPLTMPQQRGTGFMNSVNQAGAAPSPNYVQVQAQSVQFMPIQGFPGQRIGPTGPGPMPHFPGTQLPTGAANSVRAPYYCTYIPAPAFQYPAIPGVSEYQRSSTGNQLEDGQTEAKPIWGIQQPLVPGYPHVCPFGEMRCEDRSGCIPKLQWCDGHVDCNDASDETRCSCRDRITKDRLCDGYFDCPHGEDELGCFGCPRASFSCDDWSRRFSADNCVPLAQRCDGVKQCANGKDEMDCAILTPTYVEGKNVFTMSYVEGYLHKNLGGRWYPVCTPTASWASDACKSEIGPEMNGVPEIKMHTVPDQAYQGSYLAEIKGVVKVLPSCQSRIVHVRCPPIPCGSRVFSRLESMRSLNTRDNEDVLLRSTAEAKNENSTSTVPPETNDVAGGNGTSQETTTEDSLVGSQMRVVGGRASQPKAWPFLVAIYKDGYFHCGGVIINELWILTAAHCLDGYADHYFEVQAGVLRRFSFSPMAQSRKAKHTIIHSEYSSKDMQNDIGMMMLDEPLYFNRWVRPICLPQLNLLSEPAPGSTCIAIGWGATREHGPDPDHLREVEVPILPTCTHLSDQNDASICAGYPQGGRDACQGDSGGPLMCRSFFSGSHWYVAGIVSHGEGCGRPNEPGAYTRVSHFVDWIEQVSSGQGMSAVGKSPLDRCPGFNCEGGLGKCLPIEKRCNRMIDCLDGEDELNCPRQSKYSLFRQSGNDSEVIILSSVDNSTEVSGKLVNEKANIPEYTIYEDTTVAPAAAESETKKETSSGSDIETTMSSVTKVEEVPSTSTTTFICTNLVQTIPVGKRCDRTVDCEDGTDESNCTCRDFLSNLRPTAVCDGIIDCYDNSDEANCGICSETEFLCRRSGVCIPLAAKCDGKYDCELQEDERDCFTLTNGESVHLDAEGQPMLRLEGILVRNVNGEWKPTCHHPIMQGNQSTLKLIGENMCKIFGFLGLESANTTTVRDRALKTASGNEDTARLHERAEIQVTENKTRMCPGLYIRCRPVLNSSLRGFLRIDRNTGKRSHLWPWIAAIFVDGTYHCSATLLDHEWLLASANCFQGLRPDQNYIVAVLGYSPSFLYVNGPHQQVSRIDGVKYVENSASMLLHVTPSVNITRYIQPLLLERKIYPATVDDTCVAIGTNNQYETTSMFLRPVLNGNQGCNRYFINVSAVGNCTETETSDWSGTVFCRGRRGWYPAGTFNEKDGPCSFANQQNLTSIDYINPHYMEATEADIDIIPEPECHGYRCHLGQCIARSRVCDGIQDCRDGADEDPERCQKVWQDCENDIDGCKSCRISEMRCGNGKCVDKSAFCDGMDDCNDGSDEPEKCTCAEYLKRTKPERVCDGIRHCLDKSDESPETCPCQDNRFTCPSLSKIGNTCIPQDFVCDGVADCEGAEDESNCRGLKVMDINRPQSGEIIHRSFGLWHTECFSSVGETQQAADLCKSVGYTSGSMYEGPTNISEPLVPVRNHFYIVKLNRWTWVTMQNYDSPIELGNPQGDCHRAFVSCV